MGSDLKETFFRLDGAWASFELLAIRKREDYLKPFRVLKCKIDDQVDFQAGDESRNSTEASVLIEIFGEARKEVGDDVHLVTVGRATDPAYGERLTALARKAGNVHMLGYVPDVWQYYAGATVYATCSAWEGQDRPVIEAQYLGKPAVSFDNCSHPEVVFHGSLARDPGEFKDALVKHLTDTKKDLSARQRVTDRFSTKSIVRNYLNVVRRYSIGESPVT